MHMQTVLCTVLGSARHFDDQRGVALRTDLILFETCSYRFGIELQRHTVAAQLNLCGIIQHDRHIHLVALFCAIRQLDTLDINLIVTDIHLEGNAVVRSPTYTPVVFAYLAIDEHICFIDRRLVIIMLHGVGFLDHEAVLTVTEIPVDTVVFVIQLATKSHLVVSADLIVAICFISLTVDGDEGRQVFGLTAGRVAITLALTETVHMSDETGVRMQRVRAVCYARDTSKHVVWIAQQVLEFIRNILSV